MDDSSRGSKHFTEYGLVTRQKSRIKNVRIMLCTNSGRHSPPVSKRAPPRPPPCGGRDRLYAEPSAPGASSVQINGLMTPSVRLGDRMATAGLVDVLARVAAIRLQAIVPTRALELMVVDQSYVSLGAIYASRNVFCVFSLHSSIPDSFYRSPP